MTEKSRLGKILTAAIFIFWVAIAVVDRSIDSTGAVACKSPLQINPFACIDIQQAANDLLPKLILAMTLCVLVGIVALANILVFVAIMTLKNSQVSFGEVEAMAKPFGWAAVGIIVLIFIV